VHYAEGAKGEPDMTQLKALRNLLLSALRSRTIHAIAAFTLMLCAVGWGQSTAGSIDGIVTDQSGAVLPNATVTVTNENTGVVQTVVTNAVGAYTLPNLPPGTYRAAIRANGFATINTELVVPINQIIRWDEALKTGTASTTIAVTDAAAQIETESHQLDTTIGARTIEDLPANGRTLFSTLIYSTNVNGYPGDDSNDVDYFHQQANSLQIGGSVFEVTDFLQDGVMNTNMLAQTANYQPDIEATQEVSVIRNGASARFDAANDVNVVTKSGTNTFHGSAYEFFENDALDAIGEIKAPIPPLHYNQFGGNIGGPILHNRLFFFFDYSGLQDRTSSLSTDIVPTAQEHNGDFSDLSTNIYDPSTYNPSTGSISPFPNNQIPTSEISNFGAMIVAYMPLPTPSSVSGKNFQKTLLTTDNYNSYLGRLDCSIGMKDSIYGAFMTTNPVTTSDTIFVVPIFNPETTSNATNAYMEETHVFNPHMVNLSRIGYNRSKIYNTEAGVGSADFPQEFGLTALAGTAPSQWLPPGFTFQSGGYAGENGSVQGATQNLFQYSDELTFTHGRQTIFAGAELDRIQFDGNWLLANDGGFDFNGQFTSNHALTSSGGNSVADLLLGFPHTAEGAIGTTIGGFRQYNVMPYIQDDWRISKKLTLNLGLRYDYYEAPAAKNSNVYDYVTNTNHPGTYHQNYNDWAPRIGFAYSLRPTTGIRGGWGIYYAQDQYNELQFLVSNPPNVFLEDYTYTVAQAIPVVDTLTSTPSGTSALTERSLALLMPTPSVQERNLSIEQSVGSHTVVQIAYAGSNSLHLQRRIDGNQAYLPTNPSSPASEQDRRPYPWVGDVLEANDTAHGNYNALEGSVRGNYGEDSSLFASFIYSKALDDGTSEEDVPQNLYNLGPEYALSSFNRKYVMKVGGQALIPIVAQHDALFRTNSGFMNEAFGNWKLSGVIQVLSGFPFNESATNNADTGAYNPERANRSCNGNNFPGRSQKEWFNTACYSQPTAYQYGSEARDDLVGPRNTMTNLSLFKTFPFAETRSVIFRLDAFGALNHPLPDLPADSVAVPSTNGEITGFGGARVLQVSAKIAF
jgi:Carboxypeptidase regulatory-like domain/TonB dependent receptor